jgi:hypothetical protein
MRFKSFRFCMLVGAAALGAVALYYFVRYAVVLNIALDNSGVRPALQASIRALWLAFAFQALLIALLYALVAFRPRAVTREVIVLFGLLQLVEAVLLFAFSGGWWMAMLLVAVSVCVLLGAVLWPSALPPAAPAASPPPPATRSVPDAPP